MVSSVLDIESQEQGMRGRLAWMSAAAVALVALVLPLAAACGGDDDNGDSQDRLRVVATIATVGALVQEVGGDRIALTTLAGAGVDPHDYELRASDRRAIDDAKVIFRNGAGIDGFLDRAIDEHDPKVVTVTEGLTLRPADDDDHGHEEDDGHGHGDFDPHFWHDIDLNKAVVDRIAQALSEADAPNAATYRANADAYKATLDATDAEIRALMEAIPAEKRKVVTNHDSMRYFLDRYGLEFVGAVFPTLDTQGEPSAQQVARLIDTIREAGVAAILAEGSVDPKIAAEIAKDTNIPIVQGLYGDSLGAAGSGAETIHGMLLANARKIAEALQ
jgi:ABC-type Zn uptake system ZnuABC Zn-binding protein ZnuA